MNMVRKSFLLAFRRFFSKLGDCKTICSDNMKSVKAAEKEVNYFAKTATGREFQDFISQDLIWKFIIKRASWCLYGELARILALGTLWRCRSFFVKRFGDSEKIYPLISFISERLNSVIHYILLNWYPKFQQKKPFFEENVTQEFC
ncbi:hypothetical protein CEXT_486151 [Caerostris extrusa]|uniref:Integrase catalytic domain-containing protein n=1 Tax=Caerostris extrusa TaxID=172846 RepID=A0AAV4N432_CAEEX|nr:hypothetical protein CEXT_486151 [Caerostris extrusa]